MFKKVVIFFFYIMIPLILNGNVSAGELVIGLTSKSISKTLQEEGRRFFVENGFTELSSQETIMMGFPLLFRRAAIDDGMFVVSLRECQSPKKYVIIEISAINGLTLYYQAKELKGKDNDYIQIFKQVLEIIENFIGMPLEEKSQGINLGLLPLELCNDLYFQFIEKLIKNVNICLLSRKNMDDCLYVHDLSLSGRFAISSRSKFGGFFGAEVLCAIVQNEKSGFQVNAIDVQNGKIICEQSVSSGSDIDNFLKLLLSEYKKAD